MHGRHTNLGANNNVHACSGMVRIIGAHDLSRRGAQLKKVVFINNLNVEQTDDLLRTSAHLTQPYVAVVMHQKRTQRTRLTIAGAAMRRRTTTPYQRIIARRHSHNDVHPHIKGPATPIDNATRHRIEGPSHGVNT